MSESKVLEQYAEKYKDKWLDIYQKADQLREYNSETDAENAIRQAATGIHDLIDSCNSDEEVGKTGVAASYMLDSVVLAIDIVVEKGNEEDKKALVRTIEMASKTASYAMKNRNSEGFWEAVDRDKTIDNLTTVLKAEKAVSS